MHFWGGVRGRGFFPGNTLTRRFRRRQLLRRRRPPRWLNATAGLSIAALIGIALLAALLNRRGAAGAGAGLVEYAQKDGLPPVQLIVDGARAARIVILGDVPGSAAAKRIPADVLERLALGPGLDVVALDVDRRAQPYIDAYLEAPAEDASILLAHPASLPGSNPDAYLGIYRRIWQLNQKLGADRAITIAAVGTSDWPPDRALAPRTEAVLYARRGPAMDTLIEQAVFRRNPRARLFIFVDGCEALKAGSGALAVGGGAPVPVSWLGALLEQAHPGEVFTVLQDGPAGALRPGEDIAYAGTRAYPIFHDVQGLRAPFGLTVGEAFRFLRQPIVTASPPGTQLMMQPADYRLGDVVDGYIYLGPH